MSFATLQPFLICYDISPPISQSSRVASLAWWPTVNTLSLLASTIILKPGTHVIQGTPCMGMPSDIVKRLAIGVMCCQRVNVSIVVTSWYGLASCITCFLVILEGSPTMGLLPDTQTCGLHMRWECRERFPCHRLQRKPLVSDPDMHHGMCTAHVPWCMSGSLTPGGGENVPGIPAILCIWQEAHDGWIPLKDRDVGGVLMFCFLLPFISCWTGERSCRWFITPCRPRQHVFLAVHITRGSQSISNKTLGPGDAYVCLEGVIIGRSLSYIWVVLPSRGPFC